MAVTDLERLEFSMDARIDKLSKAVDKAIAKMDDGSKKIQKHAHEAGSALDKAFEKPELGKALDNIFDRSRLGVLEEGSAKIPIFGSAIEALGGAGIAAAAGLAAVAVSAEEAEKAISFARELDDASRKLGVSTGFLQEWRLMAQETGATAKDADASIVGFEQRLGQAQGGLGKRAMMPFKALGFSEADVKGFKDIDEALRAVTERIMSLGSVAQRQGVAERLGLSPMIGLLNQTTEKVAEMRAEFRSMGLIMDESLIRRGAEASHQVELLEKQIDVNLKSAFVGLAPVILYLTKLLAGMSREVGDMIQRFQPLEKRSDTALQDRLRQLMQNKATLLGDVARAGGQISPSQQHVLDGMNAQMAQIQTELGKRAQALATEVIKPPENATSLIDQTPQKKAKADKSAETFQAELDKANTDLLQARRAAATTAQEQAALDRQIAEAEKRARLDAIAKQVAEHKKDPSQGITAAEGERLRAIVELIYAAKAQAKAQDDAQKTAEDQAAKAKEQADFQARMLRSQAALARTVEQRRALELRALEIEQAAVRDQTKQKLKDDKTLTDAQRTTAMGQLGDEQAAQKAQLQRQYLGPWEKFFDEAPKSIGELNEKLQQLDVEGIRSLNAGLAEAIVNGKNVGETLQNVTRRWLAQPLEQTMQNGETALFSHFAQGASPASLMALLPHFAGGTDHAPGGLAVVGEHGQEVVNLPRGAQVIPNHRLTASRAPAGGVTVVQNITNQMDRSILASDVFDHINASSQRAYQAAVSTSIAASRQGLPGAQSSYQKLGTAG